MAVKLTSLNYVKFRVAIQKTQLSLYLILNSSYRNTESSHEEIYTRYICYRTIDLSIIESNFTNEPCRTHIFQSMFSNFFRHEFDTQPCFCRNHRMKPNSAAFPYENFNGCTQNTFPK